MIRYALFVSLLCLSACSQPPEEAAPPLRSEASVLTAPGLAPYIGVWESEDQQLRQALVISDDGEAVEACMLAPNEAGEWRVAAEGRYVAQGDEIHGRFTSEGMGFEALSAIGYPVGGDGGIDWVNTATTIDGETVTYETWAAPSAGAFTYVVERGEGVDRELWFAGKWRYRNDLQTDCG